MSTNETKVDVLPGEARINLTEYSTGITTTIAYAVMHSRPGIYWIVSDEARAAVAELIEAARQEHGGIVSNPECPICAALARIGGAA